jgi:hypothetical protein
MAKQETKPEVKAQAAEKPEALVILSNKGLRSYIVAGKVLEAGKEARVEKPVAEKLAGLYKELVIIK